MPAERSRRKPKTILPRDLLTWRVVLIISGVALFGSLFLTWYSPLGSVDAPPLTGWRSFEIIDVVLTVAAAAFALTGLAGARVLTPGGRRALVLIGGLAVLATALVILRLADPPAFTGVRTATGIQITPDLDVGGFVALAGALLGLWSCVWPALGWRGASVQPQAPGRR